MSCSGRLELIASIPQLLRTPLPSATKSNDNEDRHKAGEPIVCPAVQITLIFSGAFPWASFGSSCKARGPSLLLVVAFPLVDIFFAMVDSGDFPGAETITELIPERVGPVIFKSFLLELIHFRQIPVISPARRAKPENYWKRELIADRAYPAKKIPQKKSVIFQTLVPGHIFPDPL